MEIPPPPSSFTTTPSEPDSRPSCKVCQSTSNVKLRETTLGHVKLRETDTMKRRQTASSLVKIPDKRRIIFIYVNVVPQRQRQICDVNPSRMTSHCVKTFFISARTHTVSHAHTHAHTHTLSHAHTHTHTHRALKHVCLSVCLSVCLKNPSVSGCLRAVGRDLYNVKVDSDVSTLTQILTPHTHTPRNTHTHGLYNVKVDYDVSTHTHSHTHTHTHSRTHSLTHMHSHTCTHTHAHTCTFHVNALFTLT